MLTISADQRRFCADLPGLVETLRTAFRDGAVQPVRHHHTVEHAAGADAHAAADAGLDGLQGRGPLGRWLYCVKIVTVSPDNNAIGKPAVMGLYSSSTARRASRAR